MNSRKWIREQTVFVQWLTGLKENHKFRGETCKNLEDRVMNLKEKHGVKCVYMWHVLHGYWRGSFSSIATGGQVDAHSGWPGGRMRKASTWLGVHVWWAGGWMLTSVRFRGIVCKVGTITLVTLTGLMIFMFFLLVATANAIIVSVLMSLAAARGFLAIFFASLVAVYIGAVLVAIFAISATVISAVVGVMIATVLTKWMSDQFY